MHPRYSRGIPVHVEFKERTTCCYNGKREEAGSVSFIVVQELRCAAAASRGTFATALRLPLKLFEADNLHFIGEKASVLPYLPCRPWQCVASR